MANSYLYDFTGADTAAGSGVPTLAGNPTLTVISGSWRRLSNMAHTDTAKESNPILAVMLGGGTVDESVTVSPYGGDCLYARITDAANWLRARVRSYTYTQPSSYYTPVYTASGWTYQGYYGVVANDAASFPGPNTSYGYPVQGINTYMETCGAVNSSGAGYTTDYVYTRTVSDTGGYWTDTSYPVTAYQIILEKSIAGAITALGTVSVNAPTTLRLRAVGALVDVYYNGGASIIEVSETSFMTIGRHGIGRGPSDNDSQGLDNYSVTALNSPPNAPTLNSPAGSTTIDLAVVQRFSWTASDPDIGDSQSKFDLQYRVVGAASWTMISGTTPNQFVDFPASTFTAANNEWQVRTYDTQGALGPWSSSGFFVTASTPAGPVITSPVSGSIVTAGATLVWSAPAQTDFQVRKVADTAGNPDATVIYYDTGDMVDAVTRAWVLNFPVNNRWDHVQVRIKSGLWSAWTDTRLNVSWTPPAAPTFTLNMSSSLANLNATIINPVPAAGVPVAAYNDIFISSPLDPEVRVATLVPPNTTWVWWLPTARLYSVRVVAVAANGTTASSI